MGAEVARGAKVATRKFKQTNTPSPSPPLPAPLRQKLCGRMLGADPGDAAAVRAPSLGRASAALSRSRPKFLSREAAERILFRIYLYIYSLVLPPLPPPSSPHWSPRLSPDHTRYSLTHQLPHPRPQDARGGEKVPPGFRGQRGGDRDAEGERGGERCSG